MWKLNQSLWGRHEEEQEQEVESISDESDGLCSLSPTQRLYAFAACLVAGLASMFLVGPASNPRKNTFLLLSLIVFAKPIKFAVLFTFGNVLAAGSTVFLIGLGQQIRMMFDPVRIYATTIYIGFVVIALICALLIHSKLFTILAIICEVCALVWYSLSYIPFARRMVSELMIRFCDTEL